MAIEEVPVDAVLLFPTATESVELETFEKPTDIDRRPCERFAIPTAILFMPIVAFARLLFPVITPVPVAIFAAVVTLFIRPIDTLEYALEKFVLPRATDWCPSAVL
jgi:hypothetical protein